MMPKRKIGPAYPELQALSEALWKHGVEHGGAAEIVEALSTGPEWYAAKLSADPGAWGRFKVAFDLLRGAADTGDISPDSITIGALVWTYLRGPQFTAAVVDRMSSVNTMH